MDKPRGWLRILQEVGIVVLLTTLGKAIAFFKIQQIARQFGSTVLADALLLVMGFVLLWDAIIITGAVSVVLVSDFVRHRADGQSPFVHVGRVASGLAIAALAVGVLLWVSAPVLIRVLAPGFDEAGWELGAQLLRLFAPLPFLVVFLNIPAIVHQVEGRAAVYGSNLVILNLIQVVYLAVAGLAGRPPAEILHGFAWVFLGSHAISAAIQWAFIPPPDRREVLSALSKPTFRSFALGASPLLAGITFQEANVYINYAFASTTYEGAVAIVAFADRLVRLALAILVAPLIVVLYPRWANALATAGRENARHLIATHLAWMFLALAPLAMFFALGSGPLTTLVYGSGPSSHPGAWDDLRVATSVFAGGMLSMAFGLALMRLLVLERRTKAAVWATGLAFLVNAVLNFLLVPLVGVPGIALSTGVALTVQTGAFYAVLWRTKLLPHPWTASAFRRVATVGAGAALGVWAAVQLPLHEFFVVAIAGMAAYGGAFAVAWIFRVPEAVALPGLAVRAIRSILGGRAAEEAEAPLVAPTQGEP